MAPSPPRIFTLAAVLAAGCMLSRFVPKSTPPSDHTSPLRRLHTHSLDSDPKTSHSKGWQEWDDIDFDMKFPCGHWKCFFSSLSDPHKGYLIWVGSRYDRNAVRAHEYAHELNHDHGLRNFMSGIPHEIPMVPAPEYFLERLVGDSKAVMGQEMRDPSRRALIIQENHSAPEGAVLYKCYGMEERYETLNYLIGHGREGWDQRLQAELSDLRDILESGDGREGLLRHLQIMIDLEGKIYHLDFDRAIFKGEVRPATDNWMGIATRCLEETTAYIRGNLAYIGHEAE